MKTSSLSMGYHRVEKVANDLDTNVEEILRCVQNGQINLLAYFSNTYGSAIFKTVKTVYEADFPIDRIVGTFGNKETQLNISSIFVNGQKLQGGHRTFEPHVPNTICYNLILTGLWYIGNRLPLYFNYHSGSREIIFPEQTDIRTAPYIRVLRKEDHEDSYYGEEFEYDELTINKITHININDLFLIDEDICELKNTIEVSFVSNDKEDKFQKKHEQTHPIKSIPTQNPSRTTDGISKVTSKLNSYISTKHSNKNNSVSKKTLLKIINKVSDELVKLNAKNELNRILNCFPDIDIVIKADKVKNGLNHILKNREQLDKLDEKRLRKLIERLYNLVLNEKKKINKRFNKESIIAFFERNEENKFSYLSRATLMKVLPKEI